MPNTRLRTRGRSRERRAPQAAEGTGPVAKRRRSGTPSRSRHSSGASRRSLDSAARPLQGTGPVTKRRRSMTPSQSRHSSVASRRSMDPADRPPPISTSSSAAQVRNSPLSYNDEDEDEMSDDLDDLENGYALNSDSETDIARDQNRSQLHDSDKNEFDSLMDAYIKENYVPEKKEKIMDKPISSLLAETINLWCTTLPSREDLKVGFENCKIPENVTSLAPVLVNEIIYNRLPIRAKENDKKLRQQANYVVRAMGPLALIWDVFIKAETAALKSNCNPPALRIADKLVSIRELTACVAHSMKLLSFANAINLQRRKVSLRPFLDPKYAILATAANPVSTQLFGDNLEQRVQDIFRISQAARNPRYQIMPRYRRQMDRYRRPRDNSKYKRFSRQFRRAPSGYRRNNFNQGPQTSFNPGSSSRSFSGRRYGNNGNTNRNRYRFGRAQRRGRFTPQTMI